MLIEHFELRPADIVALVVLFCSILVIVMTNFTNNLSILLRLYLDFFYAMTYVAPVNLSIKDLLRMHIKPAV